MLSAFGTVNAQLLSVPRVYFAMARDGRFFDSIARVHPRFRTPARAILLQGVWASLLALTGTFQQIITYTAFPNYTFLSLAVLGLIVLRVREPALRRPFRVPGYPVTPILFLLVFGWYLVNSLQHAFRDTIVGIALTLAGLPVYWLFSRKRRSRISGPVGARDGAHPELQRNPNATDPTRATNATDAARGARRSSPGEKA
jgi:basic amino acid/polyamine antiporter, APA family